MTPAPPVQTAVLNPDASKPETIKDVISYLMPAALSGTMPLWPPDAFAVAAAILKRSGAYREVANVWPPKGYADTDDWHNKVHAISEEWRTACENKRDLPTTVGVWWNTIILRECTKTADILLDRDLFDALVGIVASADQASRSFGFTSCKKASAKLAERATGNLSRNTLCELIDSSRVRVMPKAHNPVSGMTLRSLTHNLALWDRTEVEPSWNNVILPGFAEDGIHLLLLPWPLTIKPNAFHKAPSNYGLRLPKRVDLFEYDISFQASDVERAIELIKEAERTVGKVHGVILPEVSMSIDHFKDMQQKAQAVFDIPLLIAGIGGPNASKLGTNGVAISTDADEDPITQSKHHRWRLDHEQAKSYGISHCLPEKPENGAWWEGIHIEDRTCVFFNANDWMAFCVLICEDLARQDPLSEMVRSVGPNLVIALLLDGPQISDRWPAHYATVLADDPRSSVLTLTSAGMVDLARSQFGGGPRSIGLWKDAITRKNQKINLEPGSEAIVLRLRGETRKEWTVDGRNDGGRTDYLRLIGIYQISPPSAGASP
jgi:hypothetical protein